MRIKGNHVRGCLIIQASASEELVWHDDCRTGKKGKNKKHFCYCLFFKHKGKLSSMWMSSLCLCQWFPKLAVHGHHLDMLLVMLIPTLAFPQYCIPKSDSIICDGIKELVILQSSTADISDQPDVRTAGLSSPFQPHSSPANCDLNWSWYCRARMFPSGF